MKLELLKPIAFFDLETTGVDVAKDRIVEISILKIHPNGNKDLLTRRINPTIPISEESTSIHGISDSDVSNEPTFAQMADELSNFFGNSDLGGYNLYKFDVPLLIEEFLRVDKSFSMKNRKIVDVQNIFHKKEQRTLSAAYQFYCNKELVDAHSAEADNVATYEILKKQLEKYSDLENNVSFLDEFSKRNKNIDFAGRFIYGKNDVPLFNFGKHKGKPVQQVLEQEKGYYGWMMNSDFSRNTKQVLMELKLKIAQDKLNS